MGHALSAKYFGCEDAETTLFKSFFNPHTTVYCENFENSTAIVLSGIMVPIVFAVIFLFIRERFITYNAIFLLGVSLLMAHGDLNQMGFSRMFSLIISFVGGIIITTAIIKIATFELMETAQQE